MSHVQWIQRGSCPGNETSRITNNFQKICWRIELWPFISIFPFKSTAGVAPSGVFIFACFPMATPDLERELRDGSDHKPHKPQKPQQVLGDRSLFPKKSHRNWERPLPRQQRTPRLRQQQPQQRTPKLTRQQRGGVAPNLPPWETLICVYQPKVVLCCAQWCRVFWCFQVYSPLVLQIWATSPMMRGPRPCPRFLRPYSGDVLAWRSSFTFRSWWWPPQWKEIWCFL